VGTWLVKYIVSPLDRRLRHLSRGRVGLSGRRPVLLLTTIGRRTGRRHVTPVFYLREGDRLIVCNVRPAGERANPWPRNLDAAPRTTVEVGRQRLAVTARRATDAEIGRWWPRLLELWPLYGRHHAATGERHVFVLEPRLGPPDDRP
jgi:F420H(2)-dependent quinone reductase